MKQVLSSTASFHTTVSLPILHRHELKEDISCEASYKQSSSKPDHPSTEGSSFVRWGCNYSVKKFTFISLCCMMFLFLYFSKMVKWTSIMAFLDLQNQNKPDHTHMTEELFVTPYREMTVEDVISSLRGNFPTATNFTSFQSSSSARHSVARLKQPRDQFCVGDTLNVLVEMRDYRGRPKAYGGDFILARIHSPKLQASASGDVTDFHNGSYRVHFTLFWPGEVQVSVLLIHPSEAVQVLWRTGKQNYNKIEYTATFVNGNKTEKATCGLRLNKKAPLCEYKDEEEGEYFACVQPPTLPCSSLNTIASHNTPGPFLTKDETRLLAKTNVGLQIKHNIRPVRVINCSAAAHRPSEKCVPGMKSPFPSGYFFANRWFSSFCQIGPFLSEDAINRCLTGRRLHVRGDSTAHQWVSYLGEKLGLTLKKSPIAWMPFLAFDDHRNITIQWKKHNPPWIIAHHISTKEFVYISRDLDSLDVGEASQDAVVIGIGQHFRAFPLEFFIHRLLNIRRAILRLQARSPQTQVFIKLENNREFSSVILRLSDWYGHMQNLAQRKVFGDLKVGLVDAWDMSVAANTFSVHPNKIVVSNEVAVALSYLCHNL
ncbi:NXPE family member 4-like isoform X2 [Megalops cyprinoides]|uniref:NXPE family member 4-like isoform X2 n=1 Tax=Megalops cyprinoides TaxID=118141 RepID=UPI001864C1D7|nr:NXPE family member 4-like isoform X2 [Megalops cyprinoides]